MRRVNLLRPELQRDPDDPAGYRTSVWRVGPTLGARSTGTSLYEITPGNALCPYHYEVGEEEWLLVLTGRPSLRTPDGVEQLEPMDLAFFPPGPTGAHKVTNETDEPVRVVMWSQVVHPTATVYPDSDKLAFWPPREHGEDSIIVRRSSGVDYWDGEA
jgi:uncharacterized cupin superfamily protein